VWNISLVSLSQLESADIPVIPARKVKAAAGAKH
jgi:hypothetical protein